MDGIKAKIAKYGDEAKKADDACKKAGWECGAGGSGGGVSKMVSAGMGLAASAAIASAFSLTTGGDATIYPGKYDITTNAFNALTLNEKTAQWGGDRVEKTFDGAGYMGDKSITVNGDAAGMARLEKALGLIMSPENTDKNDAKRRSCGNDSTERNARWIRVRIRSKRKRKHLHVSTICCGHGEDASGTGIKDVFVVVTKGDAGGHDCGSKDW